GVRDMVVVAPRVVAEQRLYEVVGARTEPVVLDCNGAVVAQCGRTVSLANDLTSRVRDRQRGRQTRPRRTAGAGPVRWNAARQRRSGTARVHAGVIGRIRCRIAAGVLHRGCDDISRRLQLPEVDLTHDIAERVVLVGPCCALGWILASVEPDLVQLRL